MNGRIREIPWLLNKSTQFENATLVEAIQVSFPDCVAKKRDDQRGDRWRRVRIEFEFRSRNFKDHGHDASRCDLIVCWEHNWPECPLSVVELRRVISELSRSTQSGHN